MMKMLRSLFRKLKGKPGNVVVSSSATCYNPFQHPKGCNCIQFAWWHYEEYKETNCQGCGMDQLSGWVYGTVSCSCSCHTQNKLEFAL